MDRFLLETTRRLVEADSVSHKGNLALMGWMADVLEDAGFRTALQTEGEGEAARANLVAWAGPPLPGGLVLSGHADVVPFEDQPGWTREPLGLALEGERAYGRGTTDMKGFLALCLDAARRLDPASLELPLVFLFTCDEEVGCRGAERLAPALAGLLGEMPVPRLGWIGEPTSWQVFHTHKGIVEFSVTAAGLGGHSGVPEAGVNAIALAARAVAAVGGLQEELRSRRRPEDAADYPESPYTTLNFGTIRGGTASNMIAERCRFSVSYRPLPGEDPAAVHREVVARLADLEAKDFGSPEGRGALEVGEPLFVAPGMRTERGSALELALRDALADERSGGAPFCTDGGHFARAGIACLICGPGDLDQAHQPDESIRVPALERGRELVPRVLEHLCGARPRP